MTFSIQDFGKSNAAQFANSTSITIPASPTSFKIAEFGLSVFSGGQVVLNATVGTQATLGSPDILYTIVRGNTVIYTVLASDLTANKFNEAGFNYTDTVQRLFCVQPFCGNHQQHLIKHSERNWTNCL